MANEGGGASREVVVKLKTEVDRASTSVAFREQAKSVESAKNQAIKVAKETTREVAQEQAAQSRRTIGILKQQEREAVALDRDRMRRQREQNRRTIGILKQQERESVAAERAKQKAIRETERTQKQTLTAHQQATGRLEALNERATEGFKQSLSGAVSLGRGIAMLGLVGEQDTQKLLQGLVKIQAVFDAMRGSIEIVQGLTRAWKAYRGAVIAAAAARTTLTAAQLAGAATTGAGIGSRVTSGAVGGVAAGAGAIVGGKVVAGGAVGGAGLIAGAGGAAAAGTAASLTMQYQFMRDVSKYGLGGGATPGSALDKMGEYAARFDMFMTRLTGIGGAETKERISAEDKLARTQRGFQLLQEERARGGAAFTRGAALVAAARQQRFGLIPQTRREAMRELHLARSRQEILRRRGEAAMPGQEAPMQAEVQAADVRHQESLKEAIRLTLREREIKRQTAKEEIAASDRRLTALRREHQEHLKSVKAIREQAMSAKERFGAMSPVEQARLVSIRRKINAGAELTRQEEQTVEAFREVTPIGGAIRRGRFRRAEAAGYAEFAGGDFETRIREAQRVARTVETKMQLEQTHQIKIQTDTAKVVDRLADAIRRLYAEQNRILVEQLKRELEGEGIDAETIREMQHDIENLQTINVQAGQLST